MSSLGNFPDQFLAEIGAQPEALRRAAEALARQRGSLSSLREAVREPRDLVFTGMGASYHACYPAINELAGRGIQALLVDTAELLHFRRPMLDPSTVVVAVSQSGESAEIVALAADLRRRRSGPLVVSVTNGLDNSLAREARVGLDTGAGPETGPSTMTFGASLVALSGVAHMLLGADPGAAIDRTRATAEVAAEAAQLLLTGAETRAEELARWHGGRGFTVLLGRGPARAASEMGALILKEAAGIPAEALQAAQFRHGPLELAGPDLAVVVMATEPEALELDLGLAGDVAQTGAAVLVVSRAGEAPEGTRAVPTGSVDRTLLPAVSIVPVQLLAWRLAVESGRAPGVLTRATKVTTRE
jgi:glutamine---fructose-6-phosphate transaminase (isomerizing)